MRVLMLATVLLAACSGGTETAENEADAERSVEPAPDAVPELPDTPADVAAVPDDAEKSESGLAWKVLEEGSGTEKPTEKSLVKVHYTGWQTDGKMFDSSIRRGSPAYFGVTQVIKGWTEGVQLMTEGEKRQFWIPGELAYGNEAKGGRPSGMLVFQIELLDIMNAPETLGTPPEDAKKLESGIAYVVENEGSGEPPTEEDQVQLAFTAWDNEGNLIRSSLGDPRPLVFKLGGAIPGWKEALQTMKPGGKTTFWMPPELVRMPPGTEGMAIFEFELIDVDKPLPAPADVAAPPADATKTESGLAYKVLEKGEGDDKPADNNSVRLDFTAWTSSDGKMIDTTAHREQTPILPMSSLPMKGMTEAVADMVVGEKRRLWVPPALAFGDHPNPSAPEGMVVVDVQLEEIMAAPAQGLPPGLRERLQKRAQKAAKAKAEGESPE